MVRFGLSHSWALWMYNEGYRRDLVRMLYSFDDIWCMYVALNFTSFSPLFFPRENFLAPWSSYFCTLSSLPSTCHDLLPSSADHLYWLIFSICLQVFFLWWWSEEFQLVSLGQCILSRRNCWTLMPWERTCSPIRRGFTVYASYLQWWWVFVLGSSCCHALSALWRFF